MGEIVFLELHEVLELHAERIECHGGDAGVRDLGLLISAIESARATFDGVFLHADLFEMAGAYLLHIVANHPFVDGNKRTGLAAALVFLELNGIEIVSEDDPLTDLVLDVARGRADKIEITAFLRAHSRSTERP